MPLVRHAVPTDEVRDLACSFCLGVLDPAESIEFEQHLPECDVCRAEVRAFLEAGVEMAAALPQVKPPAGLRDRVLQRIAPPPAPRVVVRAQQGDWRRTPFPGIEYKRLFTDLVSGTVASLVKMAPGAKYPPHRHAAFEHSYVVEGDAVFHDHTLNAGDYEVNGPDTDHSPITTKNGCIVLVIHNRADQFLTA